MFLIPTDAFSMWRRERQNFELWIYFALNSGNYALYTRVAPRGRPHLLTPAQI